MARVPGHNRLDLQVLTLDPRDYALEPARFGHDSALEFHVPAGGTTAAMVVARQQHAMAVAWRRARPNGGQALAARVGCSRSTVSRTLTGYRWAGQTVWAHVLHDLQQSAPRPRS